MDGIKKTTNLKELFPDWESIEKLSYSKYTYTIGYGRDGSALELRLFRAEEDLKELEYCFSVFVVDKNGDVNDVISFEATIFKPRIRQFSFDIYDNGTNGDKICKILEDNGIEVAGYANDYSWSYDEYFNGIKEEED